MLEEAGVLHVFCGAVDEDEDGEPLLDGRLLVQAAREAFRAQRDTRQSATTHSYGPLGDWKAVEAAGGAVDVVMTTTSRDFCRLVERAFHEVWFHRYFVGARRANEPVRLWERRGAGGPPWAAKRYYVAVFSAMAPWPEFLRAVQGYRITLCILACVLCFVQFMSHMLVIITMSIYIYYFLLFGFL